jgi:N-alpha-acetyltransferase 40
MRVKRQRAPTSPLEVANKKTDKEFITDYLQRTGSPWITIWSHPRTDSRYSIVLAESQTVSNDDLQACFNLIEETSREDYASSSTKWQPAKKLKEMKTPGLRYILVKDEAGGIRGFTSMLPVYEEGQPVVYCYEIHLKPDLQG